MPRPAYRSRRLRAHQSPSENEDDSGAVATDLDHDLDWEESSPDAGEDNESDWERMCLFRLKCEGSRS